MYTVDAGVNKDLFQSLQTYTHQLLVHLKYKYIL